MARSQFVILIILSTFFCLFDFDKLNIINRIHYTEVHRLMASREKGKLDFETSRRKVALRLRGDYFVDADLFMLRA